MQPSNSGTHKRKVRTFSIISRVFLPLGIVLTVLGTLITIASIVALTLLSINIASTCPAVSEPSGQCASMAGGVVASTTLLSLFAPQIFIGVAGIVIAVVFRGVARTNRAEDIANGVDYTNFPYGD
ncbi:MAG: hypothetical protein K6E59_02930 [Bacilli bacterium]|nr:hypothetical protein [Bacilli bacterium]